MTTRLEEAIKRLEIIEANEKKLEVELEKEKLLSFRQRLIDTAGFKERQLEMFRNFIRKNYPEKKGNIETLFNEYFELILDEKIKNVREFMSTHAE